ncbi:hypothetical protein [Zhaonella formicivorans]|uniref:hypothetical protein n=1 Tax=Zhaonella formicivorans TaxID=2528593 RepID=UPI0010D15E05|nr:hypothetical protein [Zhaonella formicivorans]
MAKAVRKQFYLRPEQSRLLAEIAQKNDLSEAEVIRRALEEYMLRQFSMPAGEPIASLAGIAASGRKRGEYDNEQ